MILPSPGTLMKNVFAIVAIGGLLNGLPVSPADYSKPGVTGPQEVKAMAVVFKAQAWQPASGKTFTRQDKLVARYMDGLYRYEDERRQAPWNTAIGKGKNGYIPSV